MSQGKIRQAEVRALKGSEKGTVPECYLRAVALLARRDHSSCELERKLAVKGYSAEAIAETIRMLTSEGFLDDRRFAQRWTESALRNGRGYGIKILQELQRRGVPRQIAAEAIKNAESEYPENDSLEAIVSRRFSAFDPSCAPLKERQRVYSYLQRRGFSLNSITSFFKIRTEEFDR